MKGVILAGGTGSRLLPLTLSLNKHLLPVGRKPMIFHAIEKLVEVGIKDIMIITGVEHLGSMVETLGSGKNFGCSFTYRVQDEAGGIAQALHLTRGFTYGERMCIILGDNIFQDSLQESVEAYRKQDRGARIMLKEVDDPTRFGVAWIGENGAIREIIEKPNAELVNKMVPGKHLAVTGIYFFDQRIYKIIETLKPSDRGELEVTDVNVSYLSSGDLEYSVLSGWWSDAGTHESIEHANALLLGK